MNCREHARVVTLLSKMEQLRDAPLPRAVHIALRELHDAVKVLQQCRINERHAILQQLRGEMIRLNDDLGDFLHSFCWRGRSGGGLTVCDYRYNAKRVFAIGRKICWPHAGGHIPISACFLRVRGKGNLWQE